MKKILSLLSIFLLSFVNAIPLISCKNIANNKPHLPPIILENELKVNSKTNIDLDKSYVPHSILLQNRSYKGTLFNQYKTETIKHLTNAFLSKTKNFNLPTNSKTEFDTYEQLQSYLNLEQQNYWQDLSKNICQKYQGNYALSDDDELLAEGFAYWLLTKQNMQTKTWELWNEYFTNYLPQIRIKKQRRCEWC